MTNAKSIIHPKFEGTLILISGLHGLGKIGGLIKVAGDPFPGTNRDTGGYGLGGGKLARFLVKAGQA